MLGALRQSRFDFLKLSFAILSFPFSPYTLRALGAIKNILDNVASKTEERCWLKSGNDLVFILGVESIVDYFE